MEGDPLDLLLFLIVIAFLVLVLLAFLLPVFFFVTVCPVEFLREGNAEFPTVDFCFSGEEHPVAVPAETATAVDQLRTRIEDLPLLRGGVVSGPNASALAP